MEMGTCLLMKEPGTVPVYRRLETTTLTDPLTYARQT